MSTASEAPTRGTPSAYDEAFQLRDAYRPETAITEVTDAAAYLAACTRAEMELEERRPRVKAEAIRRIMQTPNEDTGKPHSASSAEKIVELDPEYAGHRAQQIDAVVAKIEAKGRYEAAKLRAALAVERATQGGAQ